MPNAASTPTPSASLGRRLVSPFLFRNRVYGFLYIALALVMVVSLWRPLGLPSVDYPQHLALAGSLKRALVSGSAESQLFETNLVSYNTLFHVLVALFAYVLPIDDAGKATVAVAFVLLAGAFVSLMRATDRPEERAFALLPFLGGYLFAWGFFNTMLGLGIQLHALARFLRRGQLPASERWKNDLWIAGLGILGAYAHAPATAMVYAICFALLVARTLGDEAPLGERLGRAIRTGAPFLPAIAYVALVFMWQQRSHFNNWEYSGAEGYDDLAMRKAKQIFATAAGLRADGADQVPFVGFVFLALSEFLFRPAKSSPSPDGRVIALVGLFLYFIVPHVFLATNYMYQRMLILVGIGLAIWTPRVSDELERRVRAGYALIGVTGAVSFFAVMGAVAEEYKDLDAVLAKAPPGRRMASVVFDRNPASIAQPTFLHAGGYYVARKGGELAMSFTRTMSLPLHYRKEKVPPIPPTNFEWQPETYRNQTNAPFARHFDLVLVHAPHGIKGDLSWSLLGYFPSEAKVLAQAGRWYLVERLATANRWESPELD